MKTILIKYGETWLKSEPVRREFENKLIKNIKSSLIGLNFKIWKERGRIFIETNDMKKTLEVLKGIFGIVSFSPCLVCEKNLKRIEEEIKKILDKKKTFKIKTKRGDKKFPLISPEISKKLGMDLEKQGYKVDLKNPEQIIYVEIRKKAYIYKEKFSGPGGFPLGTQGKVISLFSGGIDSPVATWLMMKRGCEIVLLHFDNQPYTDKKNLERAKKVAKALKKWYKGHDLKFYVIKHGENLKKIIENCPRNLTCLICKRIMYRIANKIAEKENALGIVTGESLGQVASQTLENLNILNQSSTLIVFRPLISFDKTKIEEIAKKIGTFNYSILPAKTCSAAPKKPRTRGRIKEVLEAEEKINIENMINESLKTLKEVKIK